MSDVQASTARSQQLFEEAQELLPGGVDSPVRAFKAVGGTPRFIARGKGSHVWDVDGHRFIDYLASWGPLIAGHAHPGVVAAIQEAAANGTSFGATTEAELELARLVKAAFPSIDLVRFVSSGTEATMTALRLARAYSRREMILKFDGGYHGHADGLLVRAGSGPLTLGAPDSPGVPSARTLSLPYNDLAAVISALTKMRERLAHGIARGEAQVKHSPALVDRVLKPCDQGLFGARIGAPENTDVVQPCIWGDTSDDRADRGPVPEQIVVGERHGRQRCRDGTGIDAPCVDDSAGKRRMRRIDPAIEDRDVDRRKLDFCELLPGGRERRAQHPIHLSSA